MKAEPQNNGMSVSGPQKIIDTTLVESSKPAYQNNYMESISTPQVQQPIASENFSTVAPAQPIVNDGLQEAVKMSAAQVDVVKAENVNTEEVTFKIEQVQENQAVIADHFEKAKEPAPA